MDYKGLSHWVISTVSVPSVFKRSDHKFTVISVGVNAPKIHCGTFEIRSRRPHKEVVSDQDDRSQKCEISVIMWATMKN